MRNILFTKYGNIFIKNNTVYSKNKIIEINIELLFNKCNI